MKIVINTCVGFFDLSPTAHALYLVKKGIPFKFISNDDVETITSDIDKQDLFVNVNEIPRHDPDLVWVVETLGFYESSTENSNVKVIEINSDLYKINSKNGKETVVEL